MGKGIQSKKRYLISLLIGTSIFILILLLTNFIGKGELNNINSINGEMAQDIFKDKLVYSFFDEGNCSSETFGKISRDLGYSGTIINDLETKFGKDDPDVLEQKKFYTLVLLEHLEFLKDYNKKCNTSYQSILFFYSNKNEVSSKNENVGRILDIVSRDNKNLSIYSFDAELNSELIQRLIQRYNITQVPAVIIDEKFVLTSINNVEDINKYLN